MLTPKEMEELTEPWKPYRSLGECNRLPPPVLTSMSGKSGLLHVGVTGREMNSLIDGVAQAQDLPCLKFRERSYLLLNVDVRPIQAN